MRTGYVFAAAIAVLGLRADPAVAGGAGHQAHVAPPPQHGVHQQWQHSHQARERVPHNTLGAPVQAHTRFGRPRLEQRPDPNHQNPYRPMYSLDATNPGESHPYFQTRKDGFGYPPARPGPVYLGNGVYVIPR